jgi:tetratricopeptide (TPR) repeat protein
MLSLHEQAAKSSSISDYLRALRTLEALAAELRGLIALSGDPEERRTAFNWFTSAVDKQLRPTLLMPPSIVYPMELRLADFYMRMGQPKKAAQTYQEALVRRPNDLATLHGYQRALLRLDRRDDAAAIGKQIEIVRDQ